jgi:cysteine desulfurase / selenocysteine lyase
MMKACRVLRPRKGYLMNNERLSAAAARDVAEAHRDFPATSRWTYMDVAARSVWPTCVRQAVDRYLDDRMVNGGDKAAMFEMVEQTRKRFAAIINADPDEIAFTKNISEGLNIVANSAGLCAGDNVILCPELEHPNNVYPWLNLRRLGVEVRTVPPREGAINAADMLSRVDERTRVVVASSVTFAPGFRTDIDTLGRACRERGILLVVDGAQSAGVLVTDVRRSCIDALSVSTQKGLLGFYGMGFLFCRRACAEQMHPSYLARFGVDLGDAHEATMGGLDFRLQRSARRFDLGNYNYVGAAAANSSMEYLMGFGADAVEKYVVGLSHRLATGLLDLGYPVCGGTPGPHLAHIVSVGELGSGGHDSTQDPRFAALYRHLTANGVRLSIRRGILRFSLHLYNTEADVGRVLALVSKALA